MKKRIMALLLAFTMTAINLSSCEKKGKSVGGAESVSSKPTYMIYYSELNDEIISHAKKYDICILHPTMGNITRQQVKEIQSAGTLVLGYIAVGEDLRTAWMTPEQMLEDKRFTADGSGPRIDPREEGVTELDGVDIKGAPSDGGIGFASYYLDDNDHDGRPDFNPNFNCAYTNIGDPAWFEVLNKMTIDGEDRINGFKEILTLDYGRGLGCDGVFLDTIDTCAPNNYTADDDPARTRFEWTAPGVADLCAKIKSEYPDKLICQNRGLFFYNCLQPTYKYNPRSSIDYLFFESYMLDSNPTALYNDSFFSDNAYSYAPKIMAEAGRPDGFTVLSLGYCEGPEEYKLAETVNGHSSKGLDVLLTDMNEAQKKVGFSHYITNGDLTLVNDFVLSMSDNEDNEAPVWSSVYNGSTVWPPFRPLPRIGLGRIEAIAGGVTVHWDVALDENKVKYILYYQDKPFDLNSDDMLKDAQSVELIPEMGDGYENGAAPDVYPYKASVTGLQSGKKYYFLLRARDRSANHNEETNKKILICTPL